MKISIVTVCYNSARYIASAVESVLSQTHPDVEYVVIDGASKDDTPDIVRSYAPRFGGRLTLVSEKDKGIYDAMNKGVRKATGDVIGLLNADDVLEDQDVLAKYAQCFERTGAGAVFADLAYVKEHDLGHVVRSWRSGPLPRSRMRWGWHPAHPTFYVRRELYASYGLFNTEFRIGADYEFMLRLIQKHRVECAYLPERTVRMRVGGESNRSLGNIAKANAECFRAWSANGLVANPLTIPLKVLWKITQLTSHRT